MDRTSFVVAALVAASMAFGNDLTRWIVGAVLLCVAIPAHQAFKAHWYERGREDAERKALHEAAIYLDTIADRQDPASAALPPSTRQE